MSTTVITHNTAWKVSKYGVISGPYFPVFGLNTEIYGVKPPTIYFKANNPIYKSRLSKHSSNGKMFKESTQIYQKALKNSEYNHQLTYQKSINNKTKIPNGVRGK